MQALFPKSLKFVLVLSMGAGLLQSCSWVSSRRSLFGDNSKPEKQATPIKPTSVPKPTSVTKEEYDQLKSKYEALLKGNYNPEKAAQETFKNEEPQKPVNMKDPAELVEQLKVTPSKGTNSDLAETVDVFGKNGIVKKKMQLGLEQHESDIISESIESEIVKLREAESLIARNKFSEALSQLKVTENSTSRQVRVRAKYLLGEILFKQKEYDLAMQVFEEIISKDAFSGMVLKSLGRLIVCTEKLKQEKKQQQYYSILHDFFEADK